MATSPARRPELVALGITVRARRTEIGWTVVDLAEAAAMSRRFVTQIESGTGNPSIETLLAVAEALGVRASNLLARAEADESE